MIIQFWVLVISKHYWIADVRLIWENLQQCRLNRVMTKPIKGTPSKLKCPSEGRHLMLTSKSIGGCCVGGGIRYEIMFVSHLLDQSGLYKSCKKWFKDLALDNYFYYRHLVHSHYGRNPAMHKCKLCVKVGEWKFEPYLFCNCTRYKWTKSFSLLGWMICWDLCIFTVMSQYRFKLFVSDLVRSGS